ncbi:MAG: PLP-dependent transferase, partial [Acidobacteriota bacterium]
PRRARGRDALRGFCLWSCSRARDLARVPVSLICHPARMTHASIPAERRAELGLSDALIRLSPGIEHADDLIADVIDGLDAVAHKRDEKFVIGV